MLKNTAEGRVPSDSVVEDGRDEDKKRGADIAVPRSFLCGDCLGSGLFVYPEFVVHPCECPLAGLDSGAVGRGEDADERLAAAETELSGSWRFRYPTGRLLSAGRHSLGRRIRRLQGGIPALKRRSERRILPGCAVSRPQSHRSPYRSPCPLRWPQCLRSGSPFRRSFRLLSRPSGCRRRFPLSPLPLRRALSCSLRGMRRLRPLHGRCVLRREFRRVSALRSAKRLI